MTFIKRTLLLATVLFASTQTFAEIQSTDWKTSGDNLATLDTNTGIEWLGLTQTLGLSIDSVRSNMVEGGTYEGWRLPTSHELLTFFDNQLSLWGIAENKDTNNTFYRRWTTSQYNSVSDPEFDSLHHYIGNTFYRNESGVGTFYQYSWGMSFNEITGAIGLSGIRRDANGSSSSYREVRINSNNGYSDNHTNPYYGVFLVSDGGTTLSSKLDPSLNAKNANSPYNAAYDVYAPGALGLLSFSLLFASGRRRALKS